MASNHLRLNLGCGPSGIPEWINFDWGILPLLSKFPKIRGFLIRQGVLGSGYNLLWPPIRLVDIRKPFPLPDQSVEFIYCSHVLEHFERWEALHILKESHRVLMGTGTIRVVVPDLEIVCRDYLEAMKQAPSPDRRPAVEACRLIWGHPKDVSPNGFVGRLSRKFIRGHEWFYDECEMKRLFLDAGFTKVERRTFRTGQVPDLERLDLEGHANHSLYMEGSKDK